MSATGTATGKAGHQLPHTMFEPTENLVETSVPRRAGYGLPCSNCGTYYAADQSACPICHCPERVSATAAPILPALPSTQPLPDDDELEEERERFLKEFKSQLFSSHMQINTAASFRCNLEANHGEEFESAAICQACYTRLEESRDRFEAALHMDLKEAAQIVYDAVWSDPSDPSKTYQNAAQALLTELHKRAGIQAVLTTLKAYKH